MLSSAYFMYSYFSILLLLGRRSGRYSICETIVVLFGMLVDAFDEQVELVAERVVAKSDPDVGHVGALDVVAEHALFLEVRAEPVFFDPRGKAAHEYTVARKLAHVHRAEFPHLRSDAVLFHERLFGEVKLQRIVRAQAHVQTDHVILVERIFDVVKKH